MRVRSLAAILALVIVAIAVHVTALGGWWLYDDPQLLIESIQQPLAGVFFDPSEYTHLAAHTFSPMQLASFKLDLFLHGLDPRLFYIHQLLAMILAAVLLYLLLRHYVPDLYAALGSAVFLTTWAAVYATRTLMIRHYVEGLVFALAAMLAWRRGGRWTILASVFYLLAMLSKEVYATVPIFFVCQSRYEKRPWRELVSPVIAFIVFIAWRWYMTGLIGGYASDVIRNQEVTHFPYALWIHIAGPAPVWAFFVWATCIVIALAMFIWRQRVRAVAFVVLALIAMILPILPVASNFEWRYSFAFVAFLVAVLTIAAGMSRQRWTIVVLILLFATTLFTSLRQRNYYQDLTRKGIELEGRWIWTQPKTAPSLAARAPAWYLGGLAWLRKHEGNGDGPQAVFSRYAITVGMIDPARIVAIDDGHVVPVTDSHLYGTAADWYAAREHFDPNAPLTIELALRNHDAQWRLGPPAARFIFLTDPGYTAIPIPPAGKQRVPAAREQQFFRIVREEADGRWTVSPTLPVPAEGKVTVWRRLLKMKVLLDRHSDDFLESLPVRLDCSGGLIEENALDAEQRDEHRDQVEARLVTARELARPVFK